MNKSLDKPAYGFDNHKMTSFWCYVAVLWKWHDAQIQDIELTDTNPLGISMSLQVPRQQIYISPPLVLLPGLLNNNKNQTLTMTV